MSLTQTYDLQQIKEVVKANLLIERLELEDITADDIDEYMPLFGEGLGLDSVEAFEVMVGMEELYGVMVEDIPAEELKAHLHCVHSIASFILAQLQARE
ncbi:phosphopantetheine-binding protein [Paenibacillus eucommiae]|uniref:Acyl carrier protein n=1 Tax=Paenibacillus eucommiae TaxID=1355755 RepID=A0ABS4ITS9_9BACL|nr:phosphopantetheine-binding protein [Paenibacillus eucommiae]MBP1989984.1 acyl carrier protein [Paenibacillus eucommiae]